MTWVSFSSISRDEPCGQPAFSLVQMFTGDLISCSRPDTCCPPRAFLELVVTAKTPIYYFPGRAFPFTPLQLMRSFLVTPVQPDHTPPAHSCSSPLSIITPHAPRDPLPLLLPDIWPRA